MALSIGIKKGMVITIGGTAVEVTDILPDHSLASVRVNGVEHSISTAQRVEILPEVFVSYGCPPARGGEARLSPSPRLAIEAPRHIIIQRVWS